MILQKLRFKNFLSSGNAFLEMDLQKYNKSVIAGKNGNGKSTINSAITFALFGQTIKKINKSQIVNSINNKNCLVEIEFSASGKQYLVQRGIKPNIFVIHENGAPIDQTSVSDYQQFLEDSILKSSYRTFLQTSIISIENYRPFMSLPAKERRDFIEDILDIKVFSVMNQLVKSKVTKNKEELKLLELNLNNIKSRITTQKSHIDEMEKMKSVGIESIQTRLDDCGQEIIEAEQKLARANDEKDPLLPLGGIFAQKRKSRSELTLKLNECSVHKRQHTKSLGFFKDNTSCPTCTQEIDQEKTKSVTDNIQNDINVQDTIHSTLTSELDQFSTLDDEFTLYQDKLAQINSTITSCNQVITRANKMIGEIQKEKELIEKSSDLSQSKQNLKNLAKEALDMRTRYTELGVDQDYNNVMLELFKDSGIKSKIVEQYIPIINKLVNQYLEKLDFFVSFHLDSEFNEIIKSRHRDDFTYNSFSMGERQRIDVALLFTFRQLAKMKNAFSCNLLVLDELLDASMDADGIELLMNIFNSEEFIDSNLLIISHRNKDVFADAFDGIYEVYKRDNFTQIMDMSE